MNTSTDLVISDKAFPVIWYGKPKDGESGQRELGL